MAHLGTRAFGATGGEVVSTTATVFAKKKYDVPGTYLRLVDMGSEQEKAARGSKALGVCSGHPSTVFGLFGGFCGRDSGIGPAQRAKTTIWN